MQNASLLSLRRGLEGQQSQGLHAVPAYPLHPEVQSLPGSLVDPRKLTDCVCEVMYYLKHSSFTLI